MKLCEEANLVIKSMMVLAKIFLVSERNAAVSLASNVIFRALIGYAYRDIYVLVALILGYQRSKTLDSTFRII